MSSAALIEMPTARRWLKRQAPTYDPEQLYLTMDFTHALDVNLTTAGALTLAGAVLRQAIEDLHASVIPVDSDTLAGKTRMAARMDRSVGRRVEQYRRDAAEFLWNAKCPPACICDGLRGHWFDDIAAALDADADILREKILDHDFKDGI